ncbi:MAG: PQQ-dependent sugar dehydrogenase, partial [Gammaproteobacteria bacterium]|nr:PQQ-dependent sugar dehydrogenase [Gammaproteobacteria bacterium]
MNPALLSISLSPQRYLKKIGSTLAAVLCVALPVTAVPAKAQTQEALLKTERYTLKVETLASGLASPWSVALLPDGLILITEKPGNLRLLRDGKLMAAPVSGLPKVTVRGQGGLLDVVAHPGYRQNRLIFWSYAAGNESEVGTEVARGRLDCQRDLCSVSDVQVIFVQKPKASAGQHFGSRLVWDRNGHLFVTLGDRARQDEAQNLG